jgi:hypothetical protein
VVTGGLYLLMGMQDGARGVSLSGIADYQRRFVSGAQIGGVATITGNLHGVQVAGVASIARDVHGVQIGGVTTVASSLTGVQVAGAVNVADEVHGVQISTINVARRLHGVQLGVINISDGDEDAVPIGLFNFARHGQTDLDGAIDSSAMSTLLVRHGPRHFHNVWGLGYIQGHSQALGGLGLGVHNTFEGSLPVAVDLDAIAWGTLHISDGDDFVILNQLRATVAIPVGPIDIIGGAIGNVYVEDGHGIFTDLHPHYERVYHSGTTLVAIWPSAFFGLRLHT